MWLALHLAQVRPILVAFTDAVDKVDSTADVFCWVSAYFMQIMCWTSGVGFVASIILASRPGSETKCTMRACFTCAMDMLSNSHSYRR